jgi:hypothetical protein
MKRLAIFLFVIICISTGRFSIAQDVNKHLDEARSAYGAGQLDAARFALQQAMNEVDLAIGKEILKVLPTRLGQSPAIEAEDNVTFATGGYAGLFLSRNYRTDGGSSVSLQIIGDSPMLAGINAILSLPLIGAGDPNQKRIRVGNYRALMQKSTSDEGAVSWNIQVPFGSSLMTLQYQGINEEKAVTDMANTIPVDQVARLLQ